MPIDIDQITYLTGVKHFLHNPCEACKEVYVIQRLIFQHFCALQSRRNVVLNKFLHFNVSKAAVRSNRMRILRAAESVENRSLVTDAVSVLGR